MKKKNWGDWILFGLLFFTYSFFYQGGWANQNSRFDFTLAMAYQHQFSIDSFHVNTIDKASFDGHYFSEKAPGISYLALPIPFLSSFFVSFESLFKKPWIADWLLYFSTVFSISLISALSALFFRRLLILLNPDCSYKSSFWITLAIYSTTCILPYSTVLMGHQIVGSLLIIALYFGLSPVPNKAKKKQLIYYGTAFFCLGFCIFSEFPSLFLVAGVFGAILIKSKEKSQILKAMPFLFLPLIILLIHNYTIFHNLFSLGYGKLEGTEFAENMSQGFFGIRLPSLANSYQLLFGFYRGLFIYSPVLLIATASFFHWPKDRFRNVALPLLAAVVATVLMISGYSYWQGGVVFGPRHLVGCIPLLGLGLAYIPLDWGKLNLVRFIVGLSAFINLIGTATTQYVSEADTLPLLNSYIDLIKAGAVAANPMSFIDPFFEQEWRWHTLQRSGLGSFNLGTLLGIQGWYSLLVLLGIWIFGLVLLKKFSPTLTP